VAKSKTKQQSACVKEAAKEHKEKQNITTTLGNLICKNINLQCYHHQHSRKKFLAKKKEKMTCTKYKRTINLPEPNNPNTS